MKHVVIFQYRLLHYRVSLFERLKSSCLANDIQLHVVYGQPTRREISKKDVGQIQWAEPVTNKYIELAGVDILWQPTPRHLNNADLFILMQENRLISSYPKIFGLTNRNSRVAFWGHGRNFQSSNRVSLRELWKRAYIGRVDWWFAYTSMTRDILLSNEYPAERISVLDNAIDNDGFAQDLMTVDESMLINLRIEHCIEENSIVGVFCGSLYPDKRIDFLVAACDLIRAKTPNFHLVVIGDGPSAPEVSYAALTRPWLHMVGVKRGVEKAAYFKLAKIVLNPGLVGLHVLDAFCAALPLATTRDAKHSPEIAYLKNDINGIISDGTIQDYANSILEVLKDFSHLSKLGQAAFFDSKRYTLDNMVSRFSNGIQHCLASPKK